MRFSLFLLLSTLLLLTSCAGILTGTSQDIVIHTDSDDEVNAIITGGNGLNMKVTLPTTISVKKNSNDIHVILKDPCYRPTSKTIYSRYNPIALINIFWDYSTTDAITGAMWQYDSATVINARKIKKCDKKAKNVEEDEAEEE